MDCLYHWLLQLFVEPEIAVKILRNPQKATLTKKLLIEKFGKRSEFSSDLEVIKLYPNIGALLQLENSAGKLKNIILSQSRNPKWSSKSLSLLGLPKFILA